MLKYIVRTDNIADINYIILLINNLSMYFNEKLFFQGGGLKITYNNNKAR